LILRSTHWESQSFCSPNPSGIYIVLTHRVNVKQLTPRGKVRVDRGLGMELHFCSERLQAIAESTDRLDKLLGRQAAAVARQRLCELAAADNLLIAGKLPTLRFAPIPNTVNRFVIQIADTIPLIFEGVESVTDKRSVDLTTILSIRVLMIGECDGR
jgi:hypothetical protein